MKFLKIHSILFLFLSVLSGRAQKDVPLFQSEEPLQITIKTSLREVILDVNDRKQRLAELSVEKNNGSIENHIIKLRVRGVTRAKKSVCQFPPLRLNFKKGQVKNSQFHGQDKLKLVTHCANSKNYSQNTLKEYFAYKLYEAITPYSFKVRLCEITYIDSLRENRTFKQIGFLIEDVDAMAKRNGGKEYEGRLVNQEALEKETLDRMTFFQFLIGNLDWAVPNRHNMKVITNDSSTLPIGIPYDFDFAGWVNASYASPPETIPIPSVRTRVFRGICRIDQYKPTIDYYKQIRSKLEAVIEDGVFLTEKSQHYLSDYLKGFYEILEDPKKLSERLIMACRAKHIHTYSN